MLKNNKFPAARMVKVNDIELEVFEAGDPKIGKPVVLCHGWPELAYSWRSQILALAASGYHVIAPNQRGFGNSSCPKNVEAYDIEKLTGDLVGLLDHFEYEKAIFVGHDWGSAVVWGMGLLHPERVEKQINLALPYQERGEIPWIQMMEQFLGEDYYFVHFNKKPGVADKILSQNTSQFLNNLVRKDIPLGPLPEGMIMINLAETDDVVGDPILSENDLDIYTSAFKKTGFTPGINWYRNLDRNWKILGKIDPIIKHPVLMIYGEKDLIPKFEGISKYVPNITEVSLDCGHWIQQECPEETNKVILNWLVSE